MSIALGGVRAYLPPKKVSRNGWIEYVSMAMTSPTMAYVKTDFALVCIVSLAPAVRYKIAAYSNIIKAITKTIELIKDNTFLTN